MFLRQAQRDLKCPYCGKLMKSSAVAQMVRHMKENHGDKDQNVNFFQTEPEKVYKPLPIPPRKKRKAPKKKPHVRKGRVIRVSSWSWRIKTVKKILKVKKGKRTAWLLKYKIARSSIYRWIRRMNKLDQYSKHELRKISFIKIDHAGLFEEEQDELLSRYSERRRNGNKITYAWLKSHMRQICAEKQPEGYDEETCVFSNMWVRSFCKRHGISLQRKTNSKSKSIFERLHLIKNYHQWLIYEIGNCEPYFNLIYLNEIDQDEESDGYESYSSDKPTSESCSESIQCTFGPPKLGR